MGELAKRARKISAAAAVLTISLFLISVPVAAQIHGIPPSVTSIPNHQWPYQPNIPASVTSLGPYGYGNARPSNVPYGPHNGGHHRNGGYIGGYGYGYALGAAVPYYYLDPSYYGDMGGGGPYLYSSPPQGPTPNQAAPPEQTLHIVIDQPAKPVPAEQAEVATPAPQMPEARPGIPTLLVFRDGHKQEVTNYAIMGPTLYVFDKGTRKISLADLDVPATVKANEEVGMDFTIPVEKKASKPASVPRQNTPAPSQSSPNTLSSSLLP